MSPQITACVLLIQIKQTIMHKERNMSLINKREDEEDEEKKEIQ